MREPTKRGESYLGMTGALHFYCDKIRLVICSTIRPCILETSLKVKLVIGWKGSCRKVFVANSKFFEWSRTRFPISSLNSLDPCLPHHNQSHQFYLGRNVLKEGVDAMAYHTKKGFTRGASPGTTTGESSILLG